MSFKEDLKDHFALRSTIPGTRSFHSFEPIGPFELAYKHISENDSSSGTHNFRGEKNKALNIKHLQENDFVAFIYDVK